MNLTFLAAALCIAGAAELYRSAPPREYPGVPVPVLPRVASAALVGVGTVLMVATIGPLGGLMLATSVLAASWILCVLLAPVRPRFAASVAAALVVGLLAGGFA